MYEELDNQKLNEQYSKVQNKENGGDDERTSISNISSRRISGSGGHAMDDSNPFERERKPRSMDEMAAEAAILRSLFPPIK